MNLTTRKDKKTLIYLYLNTTSRDIYQNATNRSFKMDTFLLMLMYFLPIHLPEWIGIWDEPEIEYRYLETPPGSPKNNGYMVPPNTPDKEEFGSFEFIGMDED
jgi:hypothetical protein